MAVVVSLIRGINVGGHHLVPMAKLRLLCESLGLKDVTTYLQSGNVLFRWSGQKPDSVGKRIGAAIEGNFGFRPEVMVRTSAELRDAVRLNPFAEKRDLDPSKLAVLFLAGEPSNEARERLLAIPASPEEARFAGRELYVYFANGMARPKLTPPVIEKTLGVAATGRNWNTARKLLEMAEGMEG